MLPSSVTPKLLANYLTSDVVSLVDAESLSLSAASPALFAELLALLSSSKVTSRVAKDLLKEVVFDGKKPLELAESRGLLQEDNEDALLKLVTEIIALHPTVVAEYKAGKETSIQFLIGQGMKASKGSANPTILLALFKKELDA